MTNYAQVLQAKYPNKEWAITDNDYDTLEWFSDGTKPTKPTLDGLWPEVEATIAAEPAAKAAARQAVLTKLGLTDDEVKALLS